MRVNKNESRVAFDVDDTLILWVDDYHRPGEGKIRIECPYENGMAFYLVPHERHINYLKAKKERGNEVTVWSQNGWAWAKRVVETLGLSEYVDNVETKFDTYFDDLPADEWMSRVFVSSKEDAHNE